MPAKFRWDMSIHGWDKTTSVFEKLTAAILDFYFRFWFRPMRSYRHAVLHLSAKFRNNQTIVGGVMTLYPFLRWPPAAILDLIWVMLDHQRSAIASLSLILKFGLCDFYILPFWLEIAYSRPFLGSLGGIFPSNMVTHRSNPQKDHPCAETHCLSHKAWKSVQRFDLGVGSKKR